MHNYHYWFKIILINCIIKVKIANNILGAEIPFVYPYLRPPMKSYEGKADK